MKAASIGEKILALNICKESDKELVPNYEFPTLIITEETPIIAQDACEPDVVIPDGPDAA